MPWANGRASQLSAGDKLALRIAWAMSGFSVAWLARVFNVSRPTAYAVLRGSPRAVPLKRLPDELRPITEREQGRQLDEIDWWLMYGTAWRQAVDRVQAAGGTWLSPAA